MTQDSLGWQTWSPQLSQAPQSAGQVAQDSLGWQTWSPQLSQAPQSAGQVAQDSLGSHVASPHAGPTPQLPQLSESMLPTQNESQAVSQQ